MNLFAESPTGPARLWTHELAFPLSSAEIFGREGPLALEIGFGNGAFLCDLARRHPDWNLLGAEIAAASISRGVRRARREGVDNLRLYCGNGRLILWDVLPEHSVRRLIVNFPDPWPKEKHEDRRLLQAEFFELATRRLEPGGELWLTTDHREYFDFALEQGESTGLVEARVEPAPAETLQTKYAEKWQSMDLAIHHVKFVPMGVSKHEFAPRVKETPVAHARLRGDLTQVGEFEKESHEFPGGHVILLDASRSLDGGRLTFEVMVEEADLRQALLVEARPSPSGIYVGLKHFGAPVQTKGVRLAVVKVADWLASRGLSMLERTE
jgi:tRNA (guanine-N7-)-methyltransferase